MAESAAPSPGRIFISYRREETAYPAGWLYDRLVDRFGGGQVFKDVDSIQLGDDFVEVITRAVGSCDVLLVLVGDRWLTITDAHGRRRLDNPDDYVRLEIEAALTRNVRVIPILVDGARMPRADELPASLARLERRQALELSPSRFDYDTSRLLKVLDATLAEVQTAHHDAGPARVPEEKAPDSTESPKGPEQREKAGAGAALPAAGLRPSGPRRQVLIAVAAGLVVIVGGAVAALMIAHGGSGDSSHAGGNSYTADAPWRLRINDDTKPDVGCTITLTQVDSGTPIPLPTNLYGSLTMQIHQTGSFRWQASNPGCLAIPLAGSGTATLPFTTDAAGDSEAFAAPPRVAVEVKDYHGNASCSLRLYDPTDGQELDFKTARPGADTVVLDTGGRRTAYLGYEPCGSRVSAER